MNERTFDELRTVIEKISFYEKRKNLIINSKNVKSCHIHLSMPGDDIKFYVGDDSDEKLILEKTKIDLITFYKAKIDELKKKLESIILEEKQNDKIN